MVIEVVTSSSGMSAKRRSMSDADEPDTPSRPTSPRQRASSGSSPISVGMSNAVESPVCPCGKRKANRRLVSSGVPNPENIRIVQSFLRYMPACGPRANGYSPASPSFEAYVQPGPRSLGPYDAASGIPDFVSNLGRSSDTKRQSSVDRASLV